MVKSLADYMLEQSSLSGTGNIKWSQKSPADIEKSKKEKTNRKTSPTNIIYTNDKPHVKKIFKIKNTKLKKKKEGKKFQMSASNFKIMPGFSRKGR
jgi:hypothetical protein